MSGGSRNLPGDKRRKEIRLKATWARQTLAPRRAAPTPELDGHAPEQSQGRVPEGPGVCGGAGDKSPRAATSGGAGDKGRLTVTPATAQGLAAAPGGKRSISQRCESARDLTEAIIE